MPVDADMSALLGLSREQLHAHATHYYKASGATEPDVALIEYGQLRAVLKDYGRITGWFNRLIAPMLLWREATALESLAGLDGVPRLFRRIDARGLLIEYCPATPWRQIRPSDVAYERLERLVAKMHDRGIAHADLRGNGNILVDAQDQPYVIDFVSRVRRGRPWNLPWNWIFAQFVAADHSALAKLRVRHAEHLATSRDHELREPHTRLTRFARGVGVQVRRCVRFFVAR